MERQNKLRRLNDVRMQLPYLSQRALAAVLKAAKHKALPDISHRTVWWKRLPSNRIPPSETMSSNKTDVPVVNN